MRIFLCWLCVMALGVTPSEATTGRPGMTPAPAIQQIPAGQEPIRFKGMLPEVFPIPGDPRPYADSAHAVCMDKALAYITYKNRDVNRWKSLVLLDFLRRKYELHDRYTIRHTYAPHLRYDTTVIVDDRFSRLVDPNYTEAKDQIEAAEPLDRLLLRTLYCADYYQEDALLAEIQAAMDTDREVNLFGAATALLWLRDNECVSHDTEFVRVRDWIGLNLRNYLRDEQSDHVHRYQALALLYALGYKHLVQEDWVSLQADAQNEDGGWPVDSNPENRGKSDGLATVYALWALFENALPEAPHHPMPMRTVDAVEEGEEDEQDDGLRERAKDIFDW